MKPTVSDSRARTASAPRPHGTRTAPTPRPHRACTAPVPRPHRAGAAPGLSAVSSAATTNPATALPLCPNRYKVRARTNRNVRDPFRDVRRPQTGSATSHKEVLPRPVSSSAYSPATVRPIWRHTCRKSWRVPSPSRDVSSPIRTKIGNTKRNARRRGCYFRGTVRAGCTMGDSENMRKS